MKIRYLGHSSFVVDSDGVTILTDPYNESVGYPLFKQPVDAVTVSHDHSDHNAVQSLSGSYQVITELSGGQVGAISFSGIGSWHDDNQGKARGGNIIFKIVTEGLNLVHLGDLGTILNPEQVRSIGDVDILLVPVGGYYTIDASQAWEVVKQLDPRIVIPMHYKTAWTERWPIAPVEGFLARTASAIKKAELLVAADALPVGQEVIVLDIGR